MRMGNNIEHSTSFRPPPIWRPSLDAGCRERRHGGIFANDSKFRGPKQVSVANSSIMTPSVSTPLSSSSAATAVKLRPSTAKGTRERNLARVYDERIANIVNGKNDGSNPSETLRLPLGRSHRRVPWRAWNGPSVEPYLGISIATTAGVPDVPPRPSPSPKRGAESPPFPPRLPSPPPWRIPP